MGDSRNIITEERFALGRHWSQIQNRFLLLVQNFKPEAALQMKRK